MPYFTSACHSLSVTQYLAQLNQQETQSESLSFDPDHGELEIPKNSTRC